MKRGANWTVEERFPTKKAREAADAAIDELDESEPMSTFIDVWLATYRANNGIDKSVGPIWPK